MSQTLKKTAPRLHFVIGKDAYKIDIEKGQVYLLDSLNPAEIAYTLSPEDIEELEPILAALMPDIHKETLQGTNYDKAKYWNVDQEINPKNPLRVFIAKNALWYTSLILNILRNITRAAIMKQPYKAKDIIINYVHMFPYPDFCVYPGEAIRNSYNAASKTLVHEAGLYQDVLRIIYQDIDIQGRHIGNIDNSATSIEAKLRNASPEQKEKILFIQQVEVMARGMMNLMQQVIANHI